MSLLIQANLNNVPDVNRFTPLCFYGIAYFHFDPLCLYAAGDKVYLQPLHTEGQALCSTRPEKPYTLNQLAIPLDLV